MRKSGIVRLVACVVDICIVNLGFYLAFRVRFGNVIPPANLASFELLVPYVTALAAVLFWSFGLYSLSRTPTIQTLYNVLLSVLLLDTGTMALAFALRGLALPRSVLLYAAILHVIAIGGWRLLLEVPARRIESNKAVVIIGDKGDTDILARKLRSPGLRGYRIAGAFDVASEVAAACDGINRADIVCLSASLPLDAKELLIMESLDRNKTVLLIPQLYDILVHDATVDTVDDLPVFRIGHLGLSPAQRLVKRVFDICVSSVCLVVALPVIVLAALAVKLSSPGPAFYCQVRVGQNGKTFSLIKLRTMIPDAEKDTGPVLATTDDPRVTRVGRILRATRLDELPQFINVLRGDMSFVGPRPERPEFVREFCNTIPEYKYRLKVKPGITGLAQILGRYDTDAADKLRYDLYYIRNYSLLLDLQILMQTLRVMLTPESARGVSSANAKRKSPQGRLSEQRSAETRTLSSS